MPTENPGSRPGTRPVRYGAGNHGRRALIKAVMEAGYPLRVAEKAVKAIVNAWKQALLAGDKRIEMPIGYLKVRNTPRHLYRRRIVGFKVGRKSPLLNTWTIYNRRVLISWRVPEPQWLALVRDLNPGLTLTAEEFRPARKAVAAAAYPMSFTRPAPQMQWVMYPRASAPSRTQCFRR
jgi:hypothetical protein